MPDEIERLQAEWNENWRHKRRWIIVEEIDGSYSVHQHSSDGVTPPSTYPDTHLAAARLLQLLGIRNPVSPQDHPEAVCITHIASEPLDSEE